MLRFVRAALGAAFFIAGALAPALAQPTISREVLPGEIPGARPETTLTIAGGALTLTRAAHVVAAETGAADDVTSINVAAFNAGATVKLSADAGDTITFDAAIVDNGSALSITGESYAFVHVQAGGTYIVSAGGAGGAESFTSIAAIEARSFASFKTGATIFLNDGGRSGTFQKVTTDVSALVTADPQKCVAFLAQSGGAAGAFVRKDWLDRPGVVNALWCGATADGTSEDSPGSDDYAAFNAAQALARTVEVPQGVFNLGTTLKLSQVGHTLRGLVENGSWLVISHESGCGVTVTSRRSTVENLLIIATDTRRGTIGDGKEADGDHGVCVGDPTLAPGGTIVSKTQVRIAHNQIWRHPGDGVHFVGAGTDSLIDDNSISFNRRHGIFIDDGTDDGFTTKSRAGIFDIDRNLITENGGNAISLGNAGFTVFRAVFRNNETFNNAWGYVAGGWANAEVYLRTQNSTFLSGASADPGFAATTMSNGDARTGKAAKGDAIEISAVSTETTLTNLRYIDVTLPIDDKGSTGLTVDQMEISPTTAFAVSLGSTSTGVDIKLSKSTGYSTAAVLHTSPGVVRGTLTEGDKKYLLTGSSGKLALDSMVAATIASNSLNVQGSTVLLEGQGDAADDLQAIYYGGGSNPVPDGFRFTLLNKQPYNITLLHGATNVYLNGGADLVLTPNSAIDMVAIYTNNGNVAEVHQVGGLRPTQGDKILVDQNCSSTYVVAASNTAEDVLSVASVVIPETGPYLVTAAMGVRHADSAASDYSMRVLQDSTALDVHDYESRVADASNDDFDMFGSRVLWLTAGTYTYKMQIVQNPRTTTGASVFANSTSARACYLQIVRAW